ncbi:MAG: GGDEF domain-containing protein [Patescibacteria group bacterium]
MLALVKNDIDSTSVADLKALFVKLLETTPNSLKCEIHYHIFQAENVSTGSIGENLANLFTYMLQHTLSEDKTNTLAQHVSIFNDLGIINPDGPESASSQSAAYLKVVENRQWEDSTFMPIALRGTIIGYVEFPQSDAFKLFPEELPNAVSEILKSTELYLSHVSTFLANLQLQEANEKQRMLHLEQTEASYRDQLTGLYNRRGFYEKMIEFFLVQPEATGGLIAFDLDRFKKVNDELGHNGGDAVLRYAARKFEEVLNKIPGTLLTRYGGEEFIAMIPGATSEKTFEVAELMRQNLSSDPFVYQVDNKEPQTLIITTSIGVTQFSSDIGRLTAELFSDQESLSITERDERRNRVGDKLGEDISHADKALYHAKKSGRDLTVEYTPKLDHNNFQNYLAQKYSLVKKAVNKFVATNIFKDIGQRDAIPPEGIRRIFTGKGSKHVLPLRGKDRKSK